MMTPSEISLPSVGPVATDDRIRYLDLLRGFAVMAIFIVNIKAMVMPFAFYMNASLWPSQTDQLIAVVQKYLVDDKWRTTFTALYGAGLMMMWDRISTRGGTRGVLFRRTAWLTFFGAVHLFGLWTGDILFLYGVTGFLAILFVRMRARTLAVVGLIVLLLGTLWLCAFSAGPVFDPALRAELKPIFWAPSVEQIADEVARQNGPIWPRLSNRVLEGLDYLLFYVVLGGFLPVTLGLMLLGMALYRTGLLKGSWPIRRTLPLAIALLAGAWALDGLQISQLKTSDYDFDVYSLNQWMASIDGYLGSLGFCCLISVLASLGVKFKAVQAVGRMAFTNYIACTLIGTTLGVGHGAGLYGEASLTTLMFIVVATFAAMLLWSVLWLRQFRFGPLEWLWRSLVYGGFQPMRRQRQA
ncbi:MAG: DUF418 domain-containing protein [Pseudomonadota bacterium]